MSVITDFLIITAMSEPIDLVLPAINSFTIDDHGTSIGFVSLDTRWHGGDKLFGAHLLICSHSNLMPDVIRQLRSHLLNIPFQLPREVQLFARHDLGVFNDMLGNVQPFDFAQLQDPY